MTVWTEVARRGCIRFPTRKERVGRRCSKCTVERGPTKINFHSHQMCTHRFGAVGCAALPLAQLGLQLAHPLQVSAGELALHARPKRRERANVVRHRAPEPRLPPECIERAERFYEPCGAGGWPRRQMLGHTAAQPQGECLSMRLRSFLLSSSDLSAPLRWPYADFIACRKSKAGQDGRLCARAHDESALKSARRARTAGATGGPVQWVYRARLKLAARRHR